MQTPQINNSPTIDKVQTDKTVKPLLAKKRYWELDFLRGICVVLMVIDHFMFSAGGVLPEVWAWAKTDFWQGLNNFALVYWDNGARRIAQFFVVSLFMILCGISCTLSRSNLKRGIKAAIVAAGITIVTHLLTVIIGNPDMDFTVRFGVIHMIAASILIYCALSFLGEQIKKIGRRKLLDWVGRLLPALVGLVVLILFFTVPWGQFKIVRSNYGKFWALLSSVNVNASDGLKEFLCIFVDISNCYTFFSSDYYPILPFGMLVLIGSGIGQLVYKTRAKNYLMPLDGVWNKPVSFVGRHAILTYIVHQIAIVLFFFGTGAVYFLFNIK